MITSCSSQSNSDLKNHYTFVEQESKVLFVSDGDTIFVLNNQNEKNSIRLFGIDTPEIKNAKQEFQKTKGAQHLFALKSKAFTFNLVHNKKVKVVLTGQKAQTRLIGKIILNNKDLSLELLKNGLAIVRYVSLTKTNKFFTIDSDYYNLLLKYQNIAKLKKVGIWALTKSQFQNVYPHL